MTRAQFELEAVVNALKYDRLESPKLYRVHCKPHKYIPTLFVYGFRIEMEKIIFGLLDKATKDKSSDMISYSDRERFVEWFRDNMPAVINKNSVLAKAIEYANKQKNRLWHRKDFNIIAEMALSGLNGLTFQVHKSHIS